MEQFEATVSQSTVVDTSLLVLPGEPHEAPQLREVFAARRVVGERVGLGDSMDTDYKILLRAQKFEDNKNTNLHKPESARRTSKRSVERRKPNP